MIKWRHNYNHTLQYFQVIDIRHSALASRNHTRPAGGKVEPGETIKAAAVREFKEVPASRHRNSTARTYDRMTGSMH